MTIQTHSPLFSQALMALGAGYAVVRRKREQ